MNYYLIAKFIHIVGALGFFIALGAEWLSLWHARQAGTSEQVRERLHLLTRAHRVGMPSMLMTVISGFYMMAIVWGPIPWIVVSLVALVVLILLALTLTRPRMTAIAQALTTENGSVSPSLHSLLNNSLLWLSLRTRVSIALSLVFLMTVKPNLDGSLLAIGLAVGLGLASSLPVSGRTTTQKEFAD